MNKKEIVKRYLLFLIGLFINSFGVSFITKASLGTSPISSIPYTLSLGFTPTIGMFTLYMSIILIVIQMLLLRKKFPKQYFLQIPVSIIFSWFIDLTMELLKFMQPDTYWMKFLSLLIGCLILGIGVYMEMLADVVMLPGESFVKAVSVTFHTDFGKTKVVFDTSMAVIAAAIGLVMFRRLEGVREGTIIAALLVGMIARFLARKLKRLEALLFEEKKEVAQAEQAEEPEGIVITVSREYGCSGRKIAKALAEELGFTYCDRSIIVTAAKNSNQSEEYVEKREQTMTNSLLYDLFSQYQALTEEETELDRLYETESNIIKEEANVGNCVIVGRCADYILKDKKNCYNIYLYASEEYKVHQVMERDQISRNEALRRVRETNKKRATHYKYYTGRTWGLSKYYHLSLDVGALGVDECVRMIKEYCLTAQKNDGSKEIS